MNLYLLVKEIYQENRGPLEEIDPNNLEHQNLEKCTATQTNIGETGQEYLNHESRGLCYRKSTNNEELSEDEKVESIPTVITPESADNIKSFCPDEPIILGGN